jgi:hypothetical protein
VTTRYTNAAGGQVDVTLTAPLPVRVISGGGGGGGATADGEANSGTVTSVNDQATSITLLAANSARYGGLIFNDSPATLYVLFAAGTASLTNFSIELQADQGYPIPSGYTGIISGIWASDASGAARVTEFT